MKSNNVSYDYETTIKILLLILSNILLYLICIFAQKNPKCFLDSVFFMPGNLNIHIVKCVSNDW